ncbi:interferon alpha/beta receptor 1a-like isoform X3 [Conger conger]|uniref:interferon alpha/beta receptor 1a-like isoform X3 n=1 Tax=Conger conger TaxID=82655 RepID=UPI002A59D35D|nr:interferon alpha/beta receptor 1a-like isoform X3 [Conger conger]
MWVLTWRLAFIFITVTTALHSPYNVRMEPVNSRHILLWDWDQTQANCTTTFTSDYNYSNKEKTEDYKRVCYRTAGRSCDFSRQNLSYSGSFVLRVRAEAEGEISAWSSRKFSPDQQALEPPSHVEVQSGEAMLTVIITEHLTVYNLPMSALEPLSYRVQYWEKHNPQRGYHTHAVTQCKEPRHGDGQQTVPFREHCSGDPVLQVLPIQHTENPPLSHPLLDPAPGPSDGSVPPGLLQFPLGWPPSVRHQTPPTHPECSSGLQPSQILTRHPPAYFPPLAACHGSHQIQNIGASLPSS